ncbi:conserved unknown protein [Ectocarpus siliculosus]|uniref:W2 domain-containing protein n=1 Tax=Ectocarpus siliculosus TaxID=2880 RepID=D8LRC0_ECTSI|nr:conserved unknown protein [Ectocarpus siliculosus]|eukprot:CBN75025.1 conserved unknown protein [Ectocarpus siliculosus]
MSGNINISGTEPIDDPEYRYKMPRVIGKVEGRGNGIKTVIFNVMDLSLALKRDPGEVCKFFGTELGAQTRYNEEDERAIVNGAHTNATLQQLVHKYVELFVLCPNCRLPESKYKIKNGAIFHKCYACGAKEMVDMSHKLCTYIVNTAKKAKKSKDKDAAKDSKERKREKKEKKKEEVSLNGDDSAKEKKDKKKKDKKKRDKENTSDDGETKTTVNEFGDVVATSGSLEVEDAVAFDDSVAAIRRHLDDGTSNENIFEEIRTAQTFAAFPVHYRIHLFVAASFATADKVTKDDIESRAAMFDMLKSRPDDQRHIIGAFELLCQVHRPNLVGFFPVILKHLYDSDIVEEEAMLMWAGEQGRSEEFTPPALSDEQVAALRAKATPFVTWLEEADEEDGDEDDDDDEDDEDEEDSP